MQRQGIPAKKTSWLDKSVSSGYKREPASKYKMESDGIIHLPLTLASRYMLTHMHSHLHAHMCPHSCEHAYTCAKLFKKEN